MPPDSTKPPSEPVDEPIVGDYDQLPTSEWGLDWGDIALIRQKLELTPTERLRAAQDLINKARRIRDRNADRG